MLKNCIKCGKVFNSEDNKEFCSECLLENKKELKKVKDYLSINPLASIIEVCEKTGVSQAQILKFIKEGSLKIRKPLEGFKCCLCGKHIKNGSLCSSCRVKIENGFKK